MAQVFKLTCSNPKCGKEFEKLMYPSWVARGYFQYCSRACSSIAGWHTKRDESNRVSRKSVRSKDHPIANKDGRVLEYRLLLFEKIGPGTHKCNWCENKVTWTKRSTAGSSHGELAVDHIDGNKHNNDIENLVPACNKCNSLRGLMIAWEERTGQPITDLLG